MKGDSLDGAFNRFKRTSIDGEKTRVATDNNATCSDKPQNCQVRNVKRVETPVEMGLAMKKRGTEKTNNPVALASFRTRMVPVYNWEVVRLMEPMVRLLPLRRPIPNIPPTTRT